MTDDLISLLVGLGGGTVIGAAAGWAISWRRNRLAPLRDRDGPRPMDELNPKLNERIDQAAEHWAVAHGQPEAAYLVARKLRFATRLLVQRRR